MYLFGGTLTKLLAAALAVMTAVSGLPRVQCVCPNGHVKPFCTGPHAAGGGHHQTHKHPCCAAARQPADGSPGDNGPLATRACGCERTVAAATPQFVATGDDGAAARVQPAAVSAWDLAAFVPELPARLTHVGPQVHRHPPDLVVLHCHFTC